MGCPFALPNNNYFGYYLPRRSRFGLKKFQEMPNVGPKGTDAEGCLARCYLGKPEFQGSCRSKCLMANKYSSASKSKFGLKKFQEMPNVGPKGTDAEGCLARCYLGKPEFQGSCRSKCLMANKYSSASKSKSKFGRKRSLKRYKGRKVYTGPSGGKYVRVKGKKVYIPRKARGLRKQKQYSRGGRSNVSKYRGLRKSVFCGPAGGAAKGSYPVNTQKRCRAALSYARFAKRPCGIIKCALRKARAKGWKCGHTSKKAKRCMRKGSRFGGWLWGGASKNNSTRIASNEKNLKDLSRVQGEIATAMKKFKEHPFHKLSPGRFDREVKGFTEGLEKMQKKIDTNASHPLHKNDNKDMTGLFNEFQKLSKKVDTAADHPWHKNDNEKMKNVGDFLNKVKAHRHTSNQTLMSNLFGRRRSRFGFNVGISHPQGHGLHFFGADDTKKRVLNITPPHTAWKAKHQKEFDDLIKTQVKAKQTIKNCENNISAAKRSIKSDVDKEVILIKQFNKLKKEHENLGKATKAVISGATNTSKSKFGAQPLAIRVVDKAKRAIYLAEKALKNATKFGRRRR